MSNPVTNVDVKKFIYDISKCENFNAILNRAQNLLPI